MTSAPLVPPSSLTRYGEEAFGEFMGINGENKRFRSLSVIILYSLSKAYLSHVKDYSIYDNQAKNDSLQA